MGSRRVKFGVVCGSIWLSTAAASALDPMRQVDQYVSRVWDERQGLPQNSVIDILQAADGYLWLATLEGLVRFDGARFVVFDQGSNPELTSNRLQTLAADPDGYLFVGTENGGLVRFDGARFSPPEALASSGSDLGTARALLVDGAGDLWVGGRTGLWRRRRGGELRLVDDGLSVWALMNGSDGTLWIATADGLWRRVGDDLERLDLPQPWRHLPARAVLEETGDALLVALWSGAGVVRLRPGDDGWRRPRVESVVAGVSVIHLLRDRDGVVWLSSEGEGLLRLAGHQLQRWPRSGGFPSDFVLALHEDREGNLWVGADAAGLVQLRDGRVDVLGRAQGLRGDFVLSVLEDRAGDLWVGTYGSGLHRVRRINGHLEVSRLTRREGLPDDWVWSLLEDRRGDLWVGTYQGLARVRDSQVVAVPLPLGYGTWIRALLEDRAGTLWIGTDYGLHALAGKRLRTLAGGIGAPSVMSLAEGPDGTIWVGTRRGLLRTDGEAISGPFQHPLLSEVAIRALHFDGDGVLWLGTEGAGLVTLRGERVDQLTTRSGLYDDFVSAIVEDGDGDYWLSSNKGLFRVARDDLIAAADGRLERLAGQVFDTGDGMPSREASGGSQPAAWRGRDGRLHFATIRGVVSVDPRRLRRNPVPPPVLVESVEVDGERRAPPIVLEPGRHTLRIAYTATSFVAPERVRFRYRLEGYEEEWVDAGGERSVRYTNLPPGSYRFQVVAANDDGVWNRRGATVDLTQTPHLWQTLPLRLALALGALAVALAIPTLRVRALRRRAVELEAEVAERTRGLRAAKRQTEEQASRLARLDEEKSRFFANLTHELRTPLALVLGPVEAALAGDYGVLSPRLGEKLAIVRRSARQQLHLVDQLLELSRLDSGALAMAPAAVRLEVMLRELVAAFSSLADRRGIQLELELPEATPVLLADEEKLGQVFSNLLSNAMKYTPRGRKVTVSLTVDEAELKVTVRDEGPGIPPEAIELIFDRFFRVAEKGVDFGVGIGLQLARDLVALHGGRLVVESEEGRGSAFIVHLPRREAPATEAGGWRPGSWMEGAVQGVEDVLSASLPTVPAGEAAPDRVEEGSGKPLVLVVEDHPDLRRQLREEMQREFEVVEAADGVEALERIEDAMPDLVVSDIMMPRRDGFELCRAIREDPALDHLPVVLLTALADREDRLAGLRLGADAYLPKPVDREELLAVARGLVQRRRVLRDRFRTVRELKIADLAATPLDEQFLERAVAAVEERIDDPGFGVEELARAVAMSPRNLQRKLRAVTGASPHEFLLELRLQRATQLLARGAGNVSEIANRVGFSEPSSFSRAFRRRYGRPPSEAASGF